MSAIKVLRSLKTTRETRRLKKNLPVEWGALEYLTKIGIENLNRRELRNHLEARDEDSTGTRKELIERLRRSLKEEQLHAFAYTDALDAEFVLQADLEERGAVYVVGNNESGQLGLGDLEPRHVFTVIPQSRGINVTFLAASADMVLAGTDAHEIYVWGGAGSGPSGIVEKKRKKIKGEKENYVVPRLIEKLVGEEIVRVAVSGYHVVAASKGGDCFVWGHGESGQLGLGDLDMHKEPTLNGSLPAVRAVAAGANHTVVLTEANQIYVWGHAADGRLGLGASERKGVLDEVKKFFPSPCLLPLEPISSISCGREHTIAIGGSGVWAWGLGSGGKLGLGDTQNRVSPTLIPKLRGCTVKQVACGTWHSAAIVMFPPMLAGGKVYTWGSGFHGQLGQGTNQTSYEPKVVPYFHQYHHLLKFVACGSHHCAAITTTGELYTWGSNKDKCLGRDIYEVDVDYTPEPGHCGGFGVLVNKIGRGLPRYVACGHEFTVVATSPYEGPDLQVAMKLEHEQKLRTEALQMQAEQERFVRKTLQANKPEGS